MAAILAGARLVLRQGVRFRPAGVTLRPPGLTARCLSSSARLHTTAVENQRSTVQSAAQMPSSTKGWSLHRLGVSLKSFGRVKTQNFIRTYKELFEAGKPSSTQAWFLLRTCGSALPETPPTERTALANKIWNELQEMGVELNQSHYNALLKVYHENEHTFSPTEFLAGMEAANVTPNKDTYKELIAVYCNGGDVEGASTILGFMKNHNLPITEKVFNSLITGHSRAGDMESAKNMFSIMQGVGLKPGQDSYLRLVCAFAEKGDIESIKEVLHSNKTFLKDEHFLKVISTLVKAGHSQLVPQIFEFMKSCKECSQEVVNLCLELLTQGHRDAALMIATKFFFRNQQTDFFEESVNFILRHCINLNMPVKDVKICASELAKADLHLSPLQYTLFYALRDGKEDMAIELIRTLKEEGLPVLAHYYWPLLASKQKEGDLKGFFQILKEIGVEADLQTFSVFVSPVFDDAEAAKKALQEIGFEEGFNSAYLSALERGFSYAPYSYFYKLFSSKIPLVKNKAFLYYAMASLRRSNDADWMAKMTKFLFPDGSDRPRPHLETESVGHFLYGLIDGINDSLRAKEETLKQYFHQLEKMEITITARYAQLLKRLLEKRNVPQLNEAVTSLVSQKPSFKASLAELEEELQTREMNSENFKSLLDVLLSKYVSAQNLEKIVELRSKYSDYFSFSMYIKLIGYFASIGNLQEVLKLKAEIDRKEFPNLPSTEMYLSLLQVLMDNGLTEDAINILKEMQERDVPVSSYTDRVFLDILNNLAFKGDVDNVNRLHEYIVMLGLAKPTNILCSPLVSVHINRNDLSAALDVLQQCFEKYKVYANDHILLMRIVETGDTELLKKAVNEISWRSGEQTMLHSLLFAFVELGKYTEAQKVAETPGLRADLKRINWFVRRCINKNRVETLEKFVDISKAIYNCDWEKIDLQLPSLYDKNNEFEKVKSLDQKMEEEEIKVQPETIFKKGDVRRISIRLNKEVMELCKTKNFNEAYKLVLETENTDLVLTRSGYSLVIYGLLKAGLTEDALRIENIAKSHFSDFNLKYISDNLLLEEQVSRDCLKDALVTIEEMMKIGKPPIRLTINRLTETLALKGDVESLEKIKTLISGSRENMDRQLFNCKLLALFQNGNFEEATSILESQYTETNQERFPVYYLISKLIKEDMSEALEKVSLVAERLSNQFSVYQPVTELFLQYVLAGKDEEARQLLQRCNSITEVKGFLKEKMKYLLRIKKEDHISRLVNLVSDPYYKQIIYNIQLQCYVAADKDKAMALLKKMQEEHLQPDDIALRRWASILSKAGKPIPFTVPQEPVQPTAEEQSNASSPPEEKH